MATVRQLAINLVAGTADFEKGMSKAEISMKKLNQVARAAFLETRTPMERHRYEMELINQAYKSGAMNVEVYGRKIAQMQDEFKRLTAGQNGTDKLAGTLGAAGAAALRVGVTMQAIRGTVGAINIGLQAATGNIEKADELARRLPFGIGGVYSDLYTAGEGVLEVWDKVGAVAEKHEKALAATVANTQAIIAGNNVERAMEAAAKARGAAARTNAAGMTESVNREYDLVGKTGADRDRLEEINRYEDAIRRIDEQARAMQLQPADAEALKAKQAMLHEAKMQAIAEEEIAKTIKEQAEETKRLAKEREEAYRNSATGKADALVQGMFSERDLFGLEGRDRQIRELEIGGASKSSIDAARFMDAELDAMEKRQKLMEEGKQLMEDMQTPQQRYNEAVARVNELWDAGAIDADTYARAMEQEDKRLTGGADTAGTRDAAGMSADYNAGLVDFSALSGSGSSGPAKSLEDIRRLQEQGNLWLERLATQQGVR